MSTNSSQAQSATTHTFETALWLNAAVFALELVAFTLFRKHFRTIYEPRTYLPAENKRSKPLSTNIFLWPWSILRADYTLIKERNGMDAYFYVRFLRMMVRMFLPIWIISWLVLLPVDSVGTSAGLTGLDRFTFGNVTGRARFAAHLLLAWVFTFWIWWNIKREMRHFITARQRYLVDQVHSASAQANTVLITGVPTPFLTERALTNLFSHLPGGVRKVWLNRDLKELPDLYDRRLIALNKLEAAETALLNTATKLRNKREKKAAKAAKKAGGKHGNDNSSSDGLTQQSTLAQSPDTEKNLSLAEKLVPQKKRPSHRIKPGFLPFGLPFVGKQVDTIEWAKEEIMTTNEQLERGRVILRREANSRVARRGKLGGLAALANKLPIDLNDDDIDEETGRGFVGDTEAQTSQTENIPPGQNTVQNPSTGALEEETYPPLNSAFILFNQQIAAHMAAQLLTHHAPYRMAMKYTEVAPEDVVWGNLGLNPYETKIRNLAGLALTTGLIILWAFPVAFIGIVSNIAQLCVKYAWLAWLCKIPSTVLGIIQGILPAVLLAVLMMLLPIVLRVIIRLEGKPTGAQIELSLMTRYFMFQVIHGFLIVTLASGIIASLPTLVSDPTSIPNTLAMNLPKASTFFLTYAILQGLSGTASGFLQAVPLVLYYVKLFLMGSTPRSVYKIKYTMRNVKWGTLFPATTLIVVITLGYSIISPIINGLAFVTFFLFYQMYKYLFLYVFDQPASGDTGGLFLPKSMQHIFVGLYVQQICLAALFFLQQEDGSAVAIPEGALMVVLIGLTAIYNYTIIDSYGPLLHALPLSLADKSYGMPRVSDDHVRTISEQDDGFGGEEGRRKSQMLVPTQRSLAQGSGQQYGQGQGQQGYANGGGQGRYADVDDGEHDVGFEEVGRARDPDTGEYLQPTRSTQPTRMRAGKQSMEMEYPETHMGMSDPNDPSTNINTSHPNNYSPNSNNFNANQSDKQNPNPNPTSNQMAAEPTAFYHPASVEPQRVVWIPRDELGLGEEEERGIRGVGISVSMEGARMDGRGHVDIEGGPPDGRME